jgi:NACalpha-BTF3-like transcription factor
VSQYYSRSKKPAGKECRVHLACSPTPCHAAALVIRSKQVTIKLDAEDIKLVMKEMDMSKDEAELALRENGGDVAKALASAVRLPRTAFMVRQHAVAASSGR